MAATDGKLQCTVGLAIPMEFGLPWYSHIILKGTTPRSLPSAWSDNMPCACTETHWQTIESCAGVCDIPGQQAARAEPQHQIYGSFSSMLLRSTLRMQAHPPMLHKSRQHVRGTASGHSSDETLQGRAGHCMRQLLCVHTARHHPCRWKRRSLRQPCTEQESHAYAWVNEAVLALQSREKIHFNSWRHIVDHDPAQVLDKARQHMAEGTLFRSGKRGPLPEGDLTRHGAARDCHFHLDVGRRRTCRRR